MLYGGVRFIDYRVRLGFTSPLAQMEEKGMTKALITGITGQDGAYLAEFLLEQGYEVYGLVRRVRGRSFKNIEHIFNDIEIIEGSIENPLSFPFVDEVYNLAAASFVGKSWEEWSQYLRVNGIGAVNVFDAALAANPDVWVYQASTSEMFGNIGGICDEETPFKPASPYGASKLYAHEMARIYRESHGLRVSCGICFNHESPRRGEEFVSRKIARRVAGISKSGTGTIEMGEITPTRDWGHAKDYVKAMHQILQDAGPQDYIVATGESHSVQEFLMLAFSYAGLNWQDHYVKDEKFIRPAEVFELRANPSKIKVNLGWAPEYSFDDLVREMVMTEMEKLYDDEPEGETPTNI
jgi:GDPmannose 4,6-dehydratase